MMRPVRRDPGGARRAAGALPGVRPGAPDSGRSPFVQPIGCAAADPGGAAILTRRRKSPLARSWIGIACDSVTTAYQVGPKVMAMAVSPAGSAISAGRSGAAGTG
jgi:hypothetical protein